MLHLTGYPAAKLFQLKHDFLSLSRDQPFPDCFEISATKYIFLRGGKKGGFSASLCIELGSQLVNYLFSSLLNKHRRERLSRSPFHFSPKNFRSNLKKVFDENFKNFRGCVDFAKPQKLRDAKKTFGADVN